MVHILRETLPEESSRLAFGVELLKKELASVGLETVDSQELSLRYRTLEGEKLFVCVEGKSKFLQLLEETEVFLYNTHPPKGEGFYLGTCAGGLTVVVGGSETGALYGCLELCEHIRREKRLPREIAFGDEPAYVLRGPAVGLQKTTIEPPRNTYEYPITPGRFPWFYDKEHWIKFLDFMLWQRCNVLYIWSGHPFSSLVKVPEYPEALEVTEEEYQLNREIFAWLTKEADRRGIWVVLKFYNIHIPLPFAEKHHLDLLQTRPREITSDYTRKAIAHFVAEYPHIGLLVCLAEALRGDENKLRWFCDTILPGVHDGMQMGGLTEEPPIILRAHDTDAASVIKEARKIYSHMYTMWKYNGEGLTTWLPRGEWQKKHQGLADLKTTHIANIHILADLEPFRYAAPSFIQKCVLASTNRLGTNGLHLYPLFYWDWPYSPDKAEPRIQQIDRDWMWFACWFRYAWKPDRDPQLEREYWIGQLEEHFGNRMAAEHLLDALEAGGECAPRILRRFGITEGNRQTMSLGMFMSQLTNDKRYNPNVELWKSVSPQGERLDEYARREVAGEIHRGETPEDAVQDIEYYADRAYFSACEAASGVCREFEEYRRTVSDMEAIRLMSRFYTEKVRAATLVLKYRYTMNPDLSGDISLLEKALEHLEQSMIYFRELAALTSKTYLYANSMQTPQRKIPEPDGGVYDHWNKMLPLYEKELENFRRHVKDAKNGIFPVANTENEKVIPLKNALFENLSQECEEYTVENGQTVFTDASTRIEEMAGELKGLRGLRFSKNDAVADGMTLRLKLEEDAKILIGYFQVKPNEPQKYAKEWLKPETLETNTFADERGGLMPVIKNAVKIQGLPLVNVHAFLYEKGVHEIYMGTGAFLMLGAVPAAQDIQVRNAEMERESLESLDWLYE